MPAISERVVKEFCTLCNWAYEVWLSHRDLFDENPRAEELRQSPAGEALGRLSIITQEYLLHQIVRLHDPAIQAGQANLGIEYVIKFGGWLPSTRVKLEELQTELNELAGLLRSARNKILSHNDLATILSHSVHGAFPVGADRKYFAALQKFADIVHDEVVGGPAPFNDLASSDVEVLLDMLKP